MREDKPYRRAADLLVRYCGDGAADLMAELLEKSTDARVWEVLADTFERRPPIKSGYGYARKVFDSAIKQFEQADSIARDTEHNYSYDPRQYERYRPARY